MKALKSILSMVTATILLISLSLTVWCYDTVSIDMGTTYQTIDGFGAAYTWYTDRLMNHTNREEIFDEIFTECNFNILRFIYPKADKKNPTTMDVYKTIYDAAVNRGIEPLIMVTHCGAYVTKYDFSEFVKDYNSGTTFYALKKDSNGEYIYDEFAQHCVDAVKEFKDNGIPVDYFSFANEVEHQEKEYRPGEDPLEYSSFFWGTDEDEFHPAYWKAHAAIYKAFKAEFGDDAPEILGAEAMNGSLNILAPYLDPLIENYPDMLKTVAFHLYGTDSTEETFAAVDEHFEEYDLWQTEWCSSDYFENAEIIIDELNNNLNAYLYWNGVWANDEGMCLIELSYNKDEEPIYNGSHYIMKHFSKFIDRGYQRVKLESSLDSKLVAFKAPDDSRLVIVASNNTDDEERFDLDLGERQIVSSNIYQSIEKDFYLANEYMNDLGVYSKTLGIDLPTGSLTTIVIDFVEPQPESGTVDILFWAVIIGGVIIIIAAVITILCITKKSNGK